MSLTGTVLEQQATPSVLKKLKLVGTPTKVFKNSAFISGMFNSSLEVAKFEGAKLKTVSGIRGQIKRSMRDGQPGTFRATFEDKILMSDIVVCRLWVPVEVKRFYNPVLSLLTPSNQKPEEWQGMRPQAQIRNEERVPIQFSKDSLYRPIERKTRVFGKTYIPKKLEAALPFKSKSKLDKAINPKSYLARRAVVLEPEERKVRGLVNMVAAVAQDKIQKRKTTKLQKSQQNAKVKARETAKFEPVHKEDRKRKFREQGKEELRRETKKARSSNKSVG